MFNNKEKNLLTLKHLNVLRMVLNHKHHRNRCVMQLNSYLETLGFSHKEKDIGKKQTYHKGYFHIFSYQHSILSVQQ